MQVDLQLLDWVTELRKHTSAFRRVAFEHDGNFRRNSTAVALDVRPLDRPAEDPLTYAAGIVTNAQALEADETRDYCDLVSSFTLHNGLVPSQRQRRCPRGKRTHSAATPLSASAAATQKMRNSGMFYSLCLQIGKKQAERNGFSTTGR